MDGKYFYEMANNQLNMKERKAYLQTLTEEQRKLYTRYGNKVRQDKFKAKEDNKERYNEIRREYIEDLRKKEPEKMKAQNIKDVSAFRERKKTTKNNSANTLINAYKAHKARKEMEILKAAKEAAKEQAPQKKRGRPKKTK